MEQRQYTVTVQRTSRYLRKKRLALVKRRVCGTIAFISFFFLLGSVGAVEQDTISLAQGTAQMALSLGAGALFVWMAGGFDDESDE